MTILWRVKNDGEAEIHMVFPTEAEATQWAEENKWVCFHRGSLWRLFMRVC